MLRKSVTQQYPEVKPALPPRSRGVIALVEENCTSCMLCARECPDWCIYIDSHKETIPAPEGGRPRQRNVLDRFAIDFALCMYCGICIEVCPFDALFWSPEFEYAEGDIRNLLHEKDTLAAWAQTVPPPPAHDPGAEPPKELTAAPRRPASDRPARTAGAQRSRTSPEARKPVQTQANETPATAPAKEPQGTTTPPPEPAAENASEPGPTERPTERRDRRPMTNVRGIRPPGTLPSTPQTKPPGGDAASPSHETTDDDAESTTPTTPTQTPRPKDQDRESEQAGESDLGQAREPDQSGEPDPGQARELEQAEEPDPGQAGQLDQAGEPDQRQASSTGRPPPDELSTASGEPRSKPDPEVQTSAASPRRRRMADPRSIRPPGRLGPDETRESEEES
ncbi:4Fe-4S binding protein [Nonomuraea antimicrobica]